MRTPPPSRASGRRRRRRRTARRGGMQARWKRLRQGLAGALPLVAPVHVPGAGRASCCRRSIVALAQPPGLQLRPGAELRRLRQLSPRAGRPVFLAGAAQHRRSSCWSSCMSSCCSGSAWRCCSPAACRPGACCSPSVLAPYAVSEVSAAVMWRFLFDPDVGPVTNALLRARACRRSNGRSSRRTGWSLVGAAVDLAAPALHLRHPLRGAARDPERALRGGAGGRRHAAAGCSGSVTLPLLTPAILVAMLFRYIFAFRLFSEVWLMTQGGPARTTEVVGRLSLSRGLPLQRLRRRRRHRLDHGPGLAAARRGYICAAAPGDGRPCALSRLAASRLGKARRASPLIARLVARADRLHRAVVVQAGARHLRGAAAARSSTPTLAHYAHLWHAAGAASSTALLNSLIVTAGATLLAVVASALAGFAYSRHRSPASTASASLPDRACA